MKIICPHCNKEMYVKDEALGKWGRCKHCHEKIQALSVPVVNEVSDADEKAREIALQAKEGRIAQIAKYRRSIIAIMFVVVVFCILSVKGCVSCVQSDFYTEFQEGREIMKAERSRPQDTNFFGCRKSKSKRTPRPRPVQTQSQKVQHQQSVPNSSQRIPPNRTSPIARPQILSQTQPTSNESPEAKCRIIAQHEYPNDSKMQQYIYNQQIAAYRYMSNVKDQEVKRISQYEYPNDYSMQQYVYDQQYAAKNYMSNVGDAEVKRIALNEYPNDYSMQKYVYDQQIAAKNYMNTVPSGMAKQKAIREYPNDYSMQKYVYEH